VGRGETQQGQVGGKGHTRAERAGGPRKCGQVSWGARWGGKVTFARTLDAVHEFVQHAAALHKVVHVGSGTGHVLAVVRA
jgi:hypothetical protein